MPELENDQIGLGDDVIEPHDNLSVSGIPWDPLIGTVDAFYDTMDALAPTFPSEAEFSAAVETGFASAIAQIDSFFELNKNKPKNEHVVVVKGTRIGGIGGSFRLTGGGGGGVQVPFWVRAFLSEQEINEIVNNVRAIFPGLTDAEITTLIRQASASSAARDQLRRLGQVGVTTVNGQTVATITRTQQRIIETTLTSLNSPEGARALTLFRQAINSRRIRVVRG